ncbi:MAG: DUF6226 family protein [Galactobacter sp.]
MRAESPTPSSHSAWWVESDDLTPAWQRIMAEVEQAFSETGANTPPWDSPHDQIPEDQDVPEDWYERVTHPERYEILWARAQAWEQVITEHGWAHRSEHHVNELPWADEAPDATRQVTILEPLQPGGGVLALAFTGASTGDVPPGIIVATGNPLMTPLGQLPDCGCDACDGGSAELIEALDQSLIPLLDGSLTASLKTERRKRVTSYSTPFTAGSSTTFSRYRKEERITTSTRPGPWFPSWTPMPSMDPA